MVGLNVKGGTMKNLKTVRVCLLVCALMAILVSPAIARKYDTMMAGDDQWLLENYEYEPEEVIEGLPSAVEDEGVGPVEIAAGAIEGAWLLAEDVLDWLFGGYATEVSMIET